MKTLAIAVLLLFVPTASIAEYFYDGTQLQLYMKEGVVGESIATGYVAGVVDSFDGIGIFCAPVGITLLQLVAIVKKYLEENPERWHITASKLVAEALQKSFPCKK